MTEQLDYIIEQHLTKIYKTCLGFAGDHQLAKDLAQECCVNICLGFSRFRGESKISTWVYRVTVNTCLMHQRKREVYTESLDADTHVSYLDDTNTVDEHKSSRLRLLSRLISELPEKDRLIIILYLDGLSQKETSEIIGISPGYVGVRINRIKNKLLIQFKEKWDN